MSQEPFETSIELPAEGATEDFARALIDNMEQRQKSSLAMYRVHRDARALDTYRLVTYRCPRRCLLLDVFRTPAGSAVYFPPFKLSLEQNERTSPDARTERTSDGERRWVERAELLEVFKSGLYLELNCDHISRHVLTGAEIQHDIDTGTRAVTVTAHTA